jgi:DNA primase
MTVIDEIKARIDIVDLVSETVQLRRSGKNYTGFCPFHANQRTPAFAVFSDTGTWRCFGQCNEGGDIFRFVMKKEGWDFSEALRYLADKAGVSLHTPTPQEQAAAEEHSALRALLEEAVIFYRHHLVNTAAGKKALEYLRQKRGLTDETMEIFGLGYAPAGWDNTLKHFKSKGYNDQELIDAGLLTVRESDAGAPEGVADGAARNTRSENIYDRFRSRIMFPIRDERGRMSGFGARVLDPEDIPKFLNSPQGPLFDKGHLLYGLDQARRSIRQSEEAVIVEGYLDVIALHQSGFTNVVSPMGTALTSYQLALLKRSSDRIILALDADAAGSHATLRGLQVARQSMERTADPVFDPRGMLGLKARLDVDIRVVTLPEGEDPDEVVARDPQLWSELVREAKPVVIHVMETLAEGRDLDDPRTKTELASQVLPLIEDVPDPIERDTYRQRLARLLRVSERALSEQLMRLEIASKPGQRRRRFVPAEGAQAQPKEGYQPGIGFHSAGYRLEAHCLGILLRRPDLLYMVDRGLREAGLSRLVPEDFKHSDHRTIFRLLQESVDQDMAEPLNYVLGNLSLEMMDVSDAALEMTAKLDPAQDRVLDDLLRGVLDLRRRSLYQELDYLRFLQEESQLVGDWRADQYRQLVLQYTRTKMLLDKALSRTGARRGVNPTMAETET